MLAVLTIVVKELPIAYHCLWDLVPFCGNGSGIVFLAIEEKECDFFLDNGGDIFYPNLKLVRSAN